MAARSRALLALAALAVLTLLPAAGAVHWYRGPGGGCTPADGALGTPPAASGATVLMLHNTFHDLATGSPVTVIKAGQSVTWTWNSAHCHSAAADGGAFYSGYHYPAQAPSSPRVLPGFFEYPVPTLEPTLSYTHTFAQPGTFTYACEHHRLIGMVGVVVVQA